MIKQLTDLIVHGETRLVEFMLSNITLAWAVCMMLPSFRAATNPVTRCMESFIPIPFWIALFVVIGATQLVATVCNELAWRRYSSFCGAGLFCFVSLAFWNATVLLPGAMIIPIYVSSNVTAYWRVGGAIRLEERRSRLVSALGLKGENHGAHI